MALQPWQVPGTASSWRAGSHSWALPELAARAQWDSTGQMGVPTEPENRLLAWATPHRPKASVSLPCWRSQAGAGTSSPALPTCCQHPWFLSANMLILDSWHEPLWATLCYFPGLLYLFRLLATLVAVHKQHRENRIINTYSSEMDVHLPVKWQLLHWSLD